MTYTSTLSSRRTTKVFITGLLAFFCLMAGVSYARFEKIISESVVKTTVEKTKTTRQAIRKTTLQLDSLTSPCPNDTLPPVFENCPTTIHLVASLDSANTYCALAQWQVPTASDNCGLVSVIASHQNGSCFPVGTTVVSYVATDSAQLSRICSFAIVVTAPNNCANDTIKPFFERCPQNITVNLGVGTTNGGIADTCAVAIWQTPIVFDNCDSFTLQGTHQSGMCFGRGVTDVTYIALDRSSNMATCSFSVTVLAPLNPCATDTIKPYFGGCPSSVSLVTNTHQDSCKTFQWTQPVAHDNCSTPSVISSYQGDFCFPVGSTNVTYVATDSSGNSAVCSFNIDIERKPNPCTNDSIAPHFADCPLDTVHYLAAHDSCFAYQWTAPQASDDCDSLTVIASHQSGFCFPIGQTQVSYLAIDRFGNRDTCSFKVIVRKELSPCDTDSIKPVFTHCPFDTTVVIGGAATDTCRFVQWATPVATDNCGVVNTQSSHQSGMCLPVGLHNIATYAIDAKGNSAACRFKITVIKEINPCDTDRISPIFERCGKDTTLVISATSTDSCKHYQWATPIAFDNCGTPSVTGSHQNGFCFPVGQTTVTYVATDSKGNSAVCSFKVTVRKETNPCAADTVKPVFLFCPSNYTIPTTSTCATVRWSDAFAVDNCSTPTLTLSHQKGRCFPVGTTTVVYTARDARGNTTTCSFSIAVLNPCANDTVKPVIYNCPRNLTLLTSADSCARVTWTNPQAYDNCGTPTLVGSSTSGRCFPIGTNQVTFTATDRVGNSSVCSFSVTIVNTCLNDTVKPRLACPQNITVVSTDTCARVSWNTIQAYDNCSTPSVIGSHQSGFCFRTGTTSVVYTATDRRNNTATCAFTVTVNNPCQNDTLKPRLINCPTNVRVVTPDTCARVRWTAPIVSDNCGIPTLAVSHTNGACFPVGSTTVVFTATDSRRNTATCAMTIQVYRDTLIAPCDTDRIAPVFRSCPANLTVSTLSTVGQSVIWTVPSASDNCSNVQISTTHRPGGLFSIGTTTVVYTAIDNKGNSAICTFTVLVRRDTATVSTDTTKCFRIVNRKSGRVVDIQNGSTATGALAIQNTYLGFSSQQYRIRKNANGSIVLSANHSSKVLNVVSNTSNGAPVVQSVFNAATTSQTWFLTATDNGYFKMKNGASQKLLTVKNNASWSGATLEQRQDINNVSQQWKFVEVTCLSNTNALTANRLVAFEAYKDGSNAVLTWVSKDDEKADYFVVEKADETTGEFEQIGVVNAKNTAVSNYALVDKNTQDGDNVYRIQVIRPNETPQYSDVKIVNFTAAAEVLVFPNPASDELNIDLSSFVSRKVDLTIFDLAGKMVQSEKVESAPRGAHKLDVSQLPAGQYFINVKADGKRPLVKKLTIIR